MTTNLEQHYRSQRDHFEVILDALDSDQEVPEDHGSPDPYQALDESTLAIDIARHVKIALTLGGPNIWLDAELGPDGSVKSVTYEAHWGGESFRRVLGRSDPLYRAAEHYAEAVAYV